MVAKPLTEATLEDAKAVVRDRFGEGAFALLERIMRNPMRSVSPEAGTLIYENGHAICFQALMLRRCYLDGNEILGKVGGMSCLLTGAPPEAMIDIRTAENTPRAGSVLGFGNSLNRNSAAIARRLKKRVVGPESCTRYLWRALRPFECAMYFLRRKILKACMPNWSEFSTLNSVNFYVKKNNLTVRRVMDVDGGFYDVLMTRYLQTSNGLVCSRTAEEIEWIFGDRIAKGEVIVLGAFDAEGPVGYILLRSNKFAKRWEIHDWFAVRNRYEILEATLMAACRFLKRETPAMMLEVRGFPEFVQPLLRMYLSHVRAIGHNVFSCGSKDVKLRERLRAMAQGKDDCWFFGPYDGDECMS